MEIASSSGRWSVPPWAGRSAVTSCTSAEHWHQPTRQFASRPYLQPRTDRQQRASLHSAQIVTPGTASNDPSQSSSASLRSDLCQATTPLASHQQGSAEILDTLPTPIMAALPTGREEGLTLDQAKPAHLVVDGLAIGRPGRLRGAWYSVIHWVHGHYLMQECQGLEHLPLDRGAFLIASNHQSHLDCTALYYAAGLGGVEQLHALGARDYFFKQPLMRWFVTTMMGVVPFNRLRFTAKDVDALRHVRRLSSAERPAAVVIFPEGTRSMDGSMGSFKTGAGYLATRAGLPVVPAYVHGTQAAMPKNSLFPQRVRCVVRFGPPLEPPDLGDPSPSSSSSSGSYAGGCGTDDGAPSGDDVAAGVGRDGVAARRRKEELEGFALRLRAAVLDLRQAVEAEQQAEHQQQQQQGQQQLGYSSLWPSQLLAAAAAPGSSGDCGSSATGLSSSPRFRGDILPRWATAVVIALLSAVFGMLHKLELGLWWAAALLPARHGGGRGKRSKRA